jgi:hypothetical protein
MVIVFFSVIVMGACCDPLLQRLDIRMGVDNDEYMLEWRNRRSLAGPLHTVGEYYTIIFNLKHSLFDLNNINDGIYKESELILVLSNSMHATEKKIVYDVVVRDTTQTMLN